MKCLTCRHLCRLDEPRCNSALTICNDYESRESADGIPSSFDAPDPFFGFGMDFAPPPYGDELMHIDPP
jgi:hypothetical protein